MLPAGTGLMIRRAGVQGRQHPGSNGQAAGTRREGPQARDHGGGAQQRRGAPYLSADVAHFDTPPARHSGVWRQAGAQFGIPV